MSTPQRTREAEIYRAEETAKARSRMSRQQIMAVVSGVMRTLPLNPRVLKWERKLGLALENDLHLKNQL